MVRRLDYTALTVQQKFSSLIIIQRNSFAANSIVLSKETKWQIRSQSLQNAKDVFVAANQFFSWVVISLTSPHPSLTFIIKTFLGNNVINKQKIIVYSLKCHL